MNTPNLKDNSNHPIRSVTSSLHPWVYATLIGLALWFVLWIWSFAGAGVNRLSARNRQRFHLGRDNG